MTRREIKLTSTGTSPEVEFKIGTKAVVILEINAGFGAEIFGGIKAALIAKRSTEDWDSYFASGVTVPSPGGNHASIFSWHGVKFWFGQDYTLKVVGKPQASATLYVDIVVDDEIEKYLGAGHSIGGSHFAWTFPGGKPLSNYSANQGAIDDKSYVVPTNKAWLWSGMWLAERDVSATLVLEIYDENDQLFLQLDSFSAGTADVYFPGNASGVANQHAANILAMRFPFPAGWYFKATYGATQTTPFGGLPVVEVPT